MKRSMLIVMLCVGCVVLAGCVAGTNPAAHVAGPGGVVAGFWRGLWHGIIAPVTFVISLFNSRVQMYEVHNNGGWYNAGFLLGMSSAFSGGWFSGGRARRR